MATTSPHAIIFDLDGTLIDSAVQIAAAINRLRARRGGAPIAASHARGWISLGAAQLVASGLGALADEPVGDLAEFRAIYGALAPDPSDLYPHVPETLRALRNAGHRMAICTNKPEGLARRLIEGVGLAACFDGLVGARPGLPSKPHPAPVREALALLGATAATAVYVGDSEVDAEAAAAAGLPFILATFGYAIGDPSAIARAAQFDDFRDLPGLTGWRLQRAGG